MDLAKSFFMLCIVSGFLFAMPAELGIKELLLYADSAVVGFDTSPGIYSLPSGIGAFDYVLGKGSAGLQQKEIEISQSDYSIELLTGKEVRVSYGSDKQLTGTLVAFDPSEKLVLVSEGTYKLIDSAQVVSIKLLEGQKKNVSVASLSGDIRGLYSIVPSYSAYKQAHYYESDGMQSAFFSPVLVLDCDSGQSEFSVRFSNVFGTLKDTKVSFNSGYLGIGALASPSAYLNYRNVGKAVAADSAYGYQESSAPEPVLADVEDETVFSTVIKSSGFGDSLTLPLATEVMECRFKSIWDTTDSAPMRMLDVKSSKTTFPSSTLVVMKEGVPYAAVKSSQIFQANFTEVSLKQLASVKTKRTLQTSNPKYSAANSILESQDFKAELMLVNTGRTKETVKVREHVSSGWYYYSSGSSAYKLLSIDGVDDYRTDIDKIVFDVTLEPGQSKTVTLDYRVYYT